MINSHVPCQLGEVGVVLKYSPQGREIVASTSQPDQQVFRLACCFSKVALAVVFSEKLVDLSGNAPDSPHCKCSVLTSVTTGPKLAVHTGYAPVLTA